MAADDISCSVFEGLHDFGTIEVIRHGGCIGRAVEQYFSGKVYYRDTLFLERFFVLPGKRIDICSSGEGIQELDVEELQLAVELFGLEMFFTSILEDDEAGHKHP